MVAWPGNPAAAPSGVLTDPPVVTNWRPEAPPPPPVSSNPDPPWFEPDPGVREKARVSLAGKPQEDSGQPRVEKMQGIDLKVRPPESGTVEELL